MTGIRFRKMKKQLKRECKNNKNLSDWEIYCSLCRFGRFGRTPLRRYGGATLSYVGVSAVNL